MRRVSWRTDLGREQQKNNDARKMLTCLDGELEVFAASDSELVWFGVKVFSHLNFGRV